MQENERQRISFGKFCNICFQNSLFPPKKWMKLISDRLRSASTKYLNWPIPVFGLFQNGCKSCNWTSCRAILVWDHTCDFKSNLRCALVRFWNHAYDFSPNCTPLSSITIINRPCGFILTTYLPYLKLSSVCPCYIALKEDNFVVLRVVYKTENSKVVVIFKKPRWRFSLQRLLYHFSTQHDGVLDPVSYWHFCCAHRSEMTFPSSC